MFGIDQPTPFDLRFRLAGIPVRVSPWFWIIMALLGSGIFRGEGPLFLVLWVACGFVSILVHEMGHAVTANLFGSRAEVALIAFGGVATYPYPPRSPYKRIAISLAGPFAGFGLFAIILAAGFAVEWRPQNEYLDAAVRYLLIMTLFWNLLNLLPIWPMDGGKVCRELLGLAKLRNPDAACHLTSMIVAGTLAAIGILSLLHIEIPGVEGQIPRAIISVISGNLMLTFWMAMFAFTNYQMWQLTQRRGFYYEDDDTPPWRRN